MVEEYEEEGQEEWVEEEKDRWALPKFKHKGFVILAAGVILYFIVWVISQVVD